jgi:hypothetical protein
MATETQTPTRERKPKKRRAHVQLFMDAALYKRMQSRAREEDLPATTWIRRTCTLALRRKPA